MNFKETFMKVAELRIGNYFNVKPIHNRDELTTIQIKDIHQITSDNEYSIYGFIWCSDVFMAHTVADLQPIPLTEEILLKCGFEKKHLGYEHEHLMNFVMLFVNGKVLVTIRNEYYITEINHLHQLQNLYFALTNTELKVEL